MCNILHSSRINIRRSLRRGNFGHSPICTQLNRWSIETRNTRSILTQSTSRNVSGNEHIACALLELSNCPVALTLTFVSMHRYTFPSIAAKITNEIIRLSLRFNKNQRANFSIVVQKPLELLALGQLFHHYHMLLNILVRSERCVPDRNLHRIFFEKILRNRYDFFGPSCCEHQRLTIRSNLAHNFTQLRFKAHVQHAICLVQYKICHAPEVRLIGLQKIDETPGGGYNNFTPTLEVADLLAFRLASVHARILDLACGTEFIALLLDLDG
mmetsp:Transcript_15557/g.41857  ORF Transcript_15557/g.41857 Transcript_15557/m.41857 type:complete len:270 (-) Transcript_15557:519-1328(-)